MPANQSEGYAREPPFHLGFVFSGSGCCGGLGKRKLSISTYDSGELGMSCHCHVGKCKESATRVLSPSVPHTER